MLFEIRSRRSTRGRRRDRTAKIHRVSAGFTTAGSIAPIAGVAFGFENRGRLLTGAEFIVRAAGRSYRMACWRACSCASAPTPDSRR